ncbi:short-chain dehydrogenase/reductase-like protein SDR [Eremomyces bilateralis CBS 781.70]|uniref:Short-chain dehydrogenase/reductase-like protein SDR n=1 Tax=Eremomyces bilateralis CBS 781.70 TaxID=1392243 RepID=A0A6G1FSW2_9PEZI|nr:short-chain dehydrogenase/reductase-like protein SDR [Eremomyces bilateralis CBS 781.70]KAF1808771.1 short-chain dehydrogenase/reductase-like protein SDR [Eremomyces bilateralis CBS 781.70]
MTDYMSKLLSFTPTYHTDTYPAIDPLSGPTLTNRTILITGASKGIGRATAISYARAGASNIIIGARSPLDAVKAEVLAAAKKENRDAPNVLALYLDVASEESVQKMVAQVEAQFGEVDVLINNAGYLEKWVNVGDTNMDAKEWWKSWEVNILGTYLCTKFVLPLLLKKKGGLKFVMNMSSIGATFLAEGSTAYQTAKLAVMGFTERLTKEYESEGLVAVAVHPGGVSTELARNMPDKWHSLLNSAVELPANTLVWLVRGKRDWMNGRYISVEWDMAELEGMKDEIVAKDLLKAKLTM